MIMPLPKISNPTSLKDIRPISKLPVLSKILEKLVYSQVLNHLTKHNLIPDCQSGFRSKYGTSAVLAKVLDDILTELDTGKGASLLLLDYTKAFDTLGHDLLLAKLHYYGFSENVVELVGSYLSNRCQCVVLDEAQSDALPLSRGVPQGSILGPLLFLIYTADLKNNVVDCELHQFADDTQIYATYTAENAAAVYNNINSALEKISKYSLNHGLQLNLGKTQMICFGRVPLAKGLSVKLNNEIIHPLKTVKNLGLALDCDLRFRNHVNSIVQKSYTALRGLYRNKNIMSQALKRSLCDSLVLSHANYADIVYGPCLDVHSSSRIQKIQNSCVRFICSLDRGEHISPWLKELKWLNMYERRRLHLATFVHKLIKLQTPLYLKSKLKLRQTVHSRDTRNINQLYLPQYKTSLYRRSFTYSAVSLYNSLPSALIAKSLGSFRSGFRDLLFHNVS